MWYVCDGRLTLVASRGAEERETACAPVSHWRHANLRHSFWSIFFEFMVVLNFYVFG